MGTHLAANGELQDLACTSDASDSGGAKHVGITASGTIVRTPPASGVVQQRV